MQISYYRIMADLYEGCCLGKSDVALLRNSPRRTGYEMESHLHGPLHTSLPWQTDKNVWHTWQSMIEDQEYKLLFLDSETNDV